MEMDHVLARDIISDLPLNIIEHILVHMPIRDAVRTSILSRTWRYKWVTLPNLIFDDHCILTYYNDQALVKRKKLVDFVNRILFLHKGPIQRFELSVSYLQDCSDIDQWILFLSRSGIKEFILKLTVGAYFKVPCSLFSCQELSYLMLTHCMLKPPLNFNGFRCLKKLILRDVACANDVLDSRFSSFPRLELLSLLSVNGMTFLKIHAPNLKCLYLQNILCLNDALESFIARCPLLEQLSLVHVNGLTSVKIHAPNLKHLCLGGHLKDVCIANSPLLVNMYFYLHMSNEMVGHLEQVACNFFKILNCLPGLKRLVVQNDYMKCLQGCFMPQKLSTSFNHLKDLTLCNVEFQNACHIQFTLHLIDRSPNLQRLEISALSEVPATSEAPLLFYWETVHEVNFSCKQLRIVNMTNILGIQLELQFIKYMLAKSPVLQTMSIARHSKAAGGGLDMLIQLVKFQRASSQAEIIYYK